MTEINLGKILLFWDLIISLNLLALLYLAYYLLEYLSTFHNSSDFYH